MKGIFLEELLHASHLVSYEAKFIHYTNILRSLLQSATIAALELTIKETGTDELELNEWVERFREPTDGMPVHILDRLIPHLRKYYDSRIIYGWYKEVKSITPSLSEDLQEWVTFRNSRPGHGILDSALAEFWAIKTEAIIQKCILVFGNLIPVANDRGLNVDKQFIEFPLIHNGKAIVILSVRQKKGVWYLRGQELNYYNALEFNERIPEVNVLSNSSFERKDYYNLVSVTTDSNEYFLEHNIPIRQTDVFRGRVRELGLVSEWLNDDDSRRCLIYGDGGYGKTTLVLEILNEFLDGNLKIEKKPPSLICFYSAKMTRWTSNGLTRFASVQPVMDESVRELMKAFIPMLDRQWYSVSGKQLIDKAVGVVSEKGYSRDDILMVIDNSETLSNSTQENDELFDYLKYLGKKLSRLIVTSRRQENIEAEQIKVDGLTENDSLNLIKDLAASFYARPILQAGDSKLRKIVKKLMYKPLLIESLVIYISRANVSIDTALENLFKKSNDELLEFLYDDAWARLSESQKDMFYITVTIASPLTNISISKACQLVELQHGEFQDSLKETHFSSIIDYGSHYDMELVELAKKYFEKKLSDESALKKEKILEFSKEVDEYTSERAEIDRVYTEDRVAEAFRSEFSKAAKIAVDNDDFVKANDYYKMAIEDDPFNSSLHDRYSWFLLNKLNNIPEALKYSKKAVELNPNNCDAVVNLGLVYYRMYDIPKGDGYINMAERLGRPKSFCLLRKAIARYHASYQMVDKEALVKAFVEIDDLLSSAKRSMQKGAYYNKNIKDIVRYQELLLKRNLKLKK
ncbi:hypothetical protein EAG21025_28200 [Enterobacter asburiae]|uniref:tetratricopeptide repeat protein n=1 Tax=Enterobacter asburiae TaxID=61645 RepID=UPI0034E84055|nr:hypothetical protein [Enterobacter asburiae]